MTRDQARAADRMADLFARHSPGALRLAYLLTGSRQQAEDLVQDAFVRMFGRWQDLRHPAAFDSYLRRTIVNLARTQYRRRGLERTHLERESSGVQRAPGLPDVEGHSELMDALRTLSHRQRAVVVLRHFADLSEQQTAEALDCSISAVKSAASRALAKLRTELGGIDERI